jgi:hypothetical protein
MQHCRFDVPYSCSGREGDSVLTAHGCMYCDLVVHPFAVRVCQTPFPGGNCCDASDPGDRPYYPSRDFRSYTQCPLLISSLPIIEIGYRTCECMLCLLSVWSVDFEGLSKTWTGLEAKSRTCLVNRKFKSDPTTLVHISSISSNTP